MKKKLLIAALISSSSTVAFAQSAFEGFYGQIATGYENNQVSNLNTVGRESNPANGGNTTLTASNQSFGGAPLVLGLGYNASLTKDWVLGVGVDYSALSFTSSTYSYALSGPGAPGGVPGSSLTGNSLKTSQRFNVFVTPGYAIDKDKLAYLKLGYSSVQVGATPGNNVYVPSYGNFNIKSEGSGFSNQSATVGGYVLGLGYKQMISSGFYAYGEANYYSYSKPSFTSTNVYKDGSGTLNVTSNPSVSSYQLLVGVGYKF